MKLHKQQAVIKIYLHHTDTRVLFKTCQSDVYSEGMNVLLKPWIAAYGILVGLLRIHVACDTVLLLVPIIFILSHPLNMVKPSFKPQIQRYSTQYLRQIFLGFLANASAHRFRKKGSQKEKSMGYFGGIGLTKLKCLRKPFRFVNIVINLVKVQEERDEIYIEATAHYSKLCRAQNSGLIPQR